MHLCSVATIYALAAANRSAIRVAKKSTHRGTKQDPDNSNRAIAGLNPSRLWGFGLIFWLFTLIPVVSIATERLTVSVSIPAQAYFIEQIAGDKVDVTVLLPENSDPHSFAPTSSQMSELSKATLFFSAGLSVERHWGGKLSSMLPLLQTIEAAHWSQDEHFWLSPVEVRKMVVQMRDALSQADPNNADLYRSNADRFSLTLAELDTELQQLFSTVGEHNRFVVWHDAWDVFSRHYGLRQMVVEQEGKSITAPQLIKLIKTARQIGITTLFSDSGHSDKQAGVVAKQIGAQLHELNPLSADWLNNLKQSARIIRQALR